MEFDYFPLSQSQTARRRAAWEGLKNKKPFGRAAISYADIWDRTQLENEIIPADQIPLTGPAGNEPEWDIEIKNQLRNLQIIAASRFQDDSFPRIYIPRHIHGESQTVAEIFGCKMLSQNKDDTFFYSIPGIESAADVYKLKIPSLDGFRYMKVIEFAKYARETTDGQLSLQNPVMTGPMDTANYILGTMRLMEWIYEEPAALHKLLQIITDVLIDIIQRLLKDVDGKICPDFSACMNTGFGLCSETRHLVSMEVNKEFEAPYLRQIGKACGPYAFHSCGTWERTLPAVLDDSDIMMVHFQSKEMDLQKVYELTKGKVSLCIGMSKDLDEKYIWPDENSFIKYISSVFPEPIPLEMRLSLGGYLSAKTENINDKSWIF